MMRPFKVKKTLQNNIVGTDYGDAAITGKKDNSRKAYYKEFKKVVQQVDLYLMVCV